MLGSEQIDACTRYVMERARFVIESFGPRPPGSDAERQTQELVKADLEQCCDGPVTFEAFQVAQKAFFSMQMVGGVLALGAFVGYWVHPAIAFALVTLAAIVMYNQLLRYRLFLDPFFPKKTSYNVAGRQSPAGPIKRRIILNGHPDAAYEWRFNYLAPKQFPFIVLYSLLGLVVTIFGSGIATLAVWIAPESSRWLVVGIGCLLGLFVPGSV
ncbi:MAG TPA: hypothetical protein PLJ47_15345, partial [Candidatus Hydrogenedentes bacterium]|nr:hypothetical protein [Candidatus Hydrogenedentota bacterium]